MFSESRINLKFFELNFQLASLFPKLIVDELKCDFVFTWFTYVLLPVKLTDMVRCGTVPNQHIFANFLQIIYLLAYFIT